MSDKPEYCRCGRGPHGKSIPIATNRDWFGKLVKAVGVGPDGTKSDIDAWVWHKGDGTRTAYFVGNRIFARPTPKEVERGLAEGKEYKDILGKEIKLRIATETVWITKLEINGIAVYVCQKCRADILQKRKKARAKQNLEIAARQQDAMFDLAAIDARGKERKEQKNNRAVTDLRGTEFFTE